MFIVTVKGKSGSVFTAVAHSEGEMLDRVRYASGSPYTDKVTVTPL